MQQIWKNTLTVKYTSWNLNLLSVIIMPMTVMPLRNHQNCSIHSRNLVAREDYTLPDIISI